MLKIHLNLSISSSMWASVSCSDSQSIILKLQCNWYGKKKFESRETKIIIASKSTRICGVDHAWINMKDIHESLVLAVKFCQFVQCGKINSALTLRDNSLWQIPENERLVMELQLLSLVQLYTQCYDLLKKMSLNCSYCIITCV